MNWLDLKLGGRMLVKYPGLTSVGGMAMAFALLGCVVPARRALNIEPTIVLLTE